MNNFTLYSCGVSFFNHEPQKIRTKYTELARCDQDEYVFINNLINKYPGKNIALNADHYHDYDDNSCSFALVISEVIVEDNPDYDLEFAKYKKELAEYKKVLTEWEEWKKAEMKKIDVLNKMLKNRNI